MATHPPPDAAGLDADQKHRLEEFIEEEEGHLNRYKGWLARFLTVVAVASSEGSLHGRGSTSNRSSDSDSSPSVNRCRAVTSSRDSSGSTNTGPASGDPGSS